jgi:DNA-binding NarL/FixJ family response regulator
VILKRGGALETSRIHVLIVDDFEPWRRFVCSALANHPELQVIAEASDGLMAVQKAEELQPDLILLDIGLPALNGIEAARRIRKLSNSRILFISEHRSADLAKEAMRAGAHGFLVKSDAGSELLPAVTAVLEDRRYASTSLGGHAFIDHLDEQPEDHPPFDCVSIPQARTNVEVSRHHEVAFYPNDASFIDGFARFAKSALKSGNSIVVVATKSHRDGIRQRLTEDAVDLDTAIKAGSYVEADAIQTLSAVMANDMPAADRVAAIATNLITRASKGAQQERSRVAICGELAPTLLAEGKTEAAMQMERLFDEITRAHGLNLLCGYVLSTAPHKKNSQIVERICSEHSAVHMA